MGLHKVKVNEEVHKSAVERRGERMQRVCAGTPPPYHSVPLSVLTMPPPEDGEDIT
jgi:hypothetical protein